MIFVLIKEGWLNKKEYKNNDMNLFKSGHKTFKTKINQFTKNQKLEIILNRKNIGEQIFVFELEENKKQRTLLSTMTILNLLDSSHNKMIINNFEKNMKQFNNQIRDELERRGLNAYF